MQTVGISANFVAKPIHSKAKETRARTAWMSEALRAWAGRPQSDRNLPSVSRPERNFPLKLLQIASQDLFPGFYCVLPSLCTTLLVFVLALLFLFCSGSVITRVIGSATNIMYVTNQLLPYSGVVVTDQRPRLSQIVHRVTS